jgi:hypothetical protein
MSIWKKIKAGTFVNSVDIHHLQPLLDHVRIVRTTSMFISPRNAADIHVNIAVMSHHPHQVVLVQKVPIKDMNICRNLECWEVQPFSLLELIFSIFGEENYVIRSFKRYISKRYSPFQ